VTRLTGSSAVLLVSDIGRAVEFWRDRLGFECEVYGDPPVRVDDADAVYAELQERGAPIDHTIYDAPHGFREFGTHHRDGHDIAFGRPLSA